MDRSTPITLIGQTRKQDKFGVWRTTPSSRVVFCDVRSATASEFFEGGRNGLNPALTFTMFRHDYNGETVVEYEGNRYAVYRTYVRRGDDIELHVERKGGTNAAKEDRGD